MNKHLHPVFLLILFAALLFGIVPRAEASRVEADPSNSTIPVAHSAPLPDGSYIPESFTFSGGTGKVKITCDDVLVENGSAYAVIRFSSSSYSYVKTNGMIYYAEIEDGKSVFTIPIVLDQNNRILALTTKMSTPHEIEYTIRVQLQDQGADSRIPGFTLLEEQVSDHLKLCRYEGDILIFEIDTGIKSVESAISEEDAVTADYTAAIYRSRILRYIAAPEDIDLPAGMEKEYILIRKPLLRVCAAGEDMSHRLEEWNLSERLCNQLDWNSPDYKALLLSKTDMVLAEGSCLPVLRDRAADRFAALGIPVLVDYSCEDDASIWAQLYTLLFDMEE